MCSWILTNPNLKPGIPMNESARAKGRRAKRDGTEINQGDHLVSNWIEDATATNAVATATRAAEAGKTHYITAIIASYSAAAVGDLTFKDGAAAEFTFTVHNAEVITFAKPVPVTAGNAVSADLAAGGASVDGNVVLIGYTA